MIKKIKNSALIISVIFIVFLFLPSLSNAAWVGDSASNATLALSPDSGTYRRATGVTFDIDIIINTHGQNVTAAGAILNFSPSAAFSVSVLSCGDATKPSAFYISGSCGQDKIVNNISTTGKLYITRTSPNAAVSPYAPIPINTASGRFATLRITGLTDTAPAVDNITFDFSYPTLNPDLTAIFLADNTNIISGVDNGRITLDGTPPPNVTIFTASPTNGQIALSWTKPSSTDWLGVTIIRKVGSYPTSRTDGTQVYDGSGTSYTDTGVTNGTAYYYNAYSRDLVLNYSTPGSGSQAYATPIDNIAPSQISNLAASNYIPATPTLLFKTINLSWTAVGNDGSIGTATSYDIRYSTAAITAANFASATQVSGEPSPRVSMSAETMSLSGPNFIGNTTYYWAIKASDAAGNWSPISNIPPGVTTLKSADINLDNKVNSADLSLVLNWWLDATKSAADIDQSSSVFTTDLNSVITQWTGA